METSRQLKAGEIRLDYLPEHLPYVAIGADKAPYQIGWQRRGLSSSEVAEEYYAGKAKAIGLLAGPIGNEPMGLVWVDVDGPSVFALVQELSGLPFEEALPKTLAIASGREGRLRKLYQVSKDSFELFSRNKYVWRTEGEVNQQLEVLWEKRQGILMGAHPETDGYYTLEGEGFEHIDALPELPAWIETAIAVKNKINGNPEASTSRWVGTNFAINSRTDIDRDIQLAKQALWALPLEHVDSYEHWLTAGQVLHSIDDTCLEIWDEWSAQSDKYRKGECRRKWQSFDSKGGLKIGTLIEEAKKHGFKQDQSGKAHSVSDDELERAASFLSQVQDQDDIATTDIYEPTGNDPMQQLMSLEKPKKSSNRKSNKTSISEDQVIELLAQHYGEDLKFCKFQKIFRKYNKATGHWQALDENAFKADLIEQLTVLKEGGAISAWNATLIKNCLFVLEAKYSFSNWYAANDHLVFSNGVLHVPTMKLLSVSENAQAIHDLFLINYHPYPYLKDAVATETLKWLSWTQHDRKDRVKLLQAFLRAVLLQASEVQKFLELVGYGKTGKTTFANICTALVGHENMVSTNFREMESNKFELTNFVGKKLLLLPDQGKYGGGVDNLKALCGGDSLRAEVKGKQETKMFQFRGMIIITANQEMQSTDKTSGLSRRRITIYFNRVFQGAPSEQKVLLSFDVQNNPIGVFAKELPGLINWVLAMPEGEMKNFLMDTKNNVEGFKEEESKRDRKVSTLHDWLGEHVIYDPDYWTPIGLAKENRNTQEGNHRFCNFATHLYPSYLEHCVNIAQNKTSRGNFIDGLEEFCRINNLEVTKRDEKRTKGYQGLRLRNESSIVEQNDWPSILDYVNDKKKFKHIYEKS